MQKEEWDPSLLLRDISAVAGVLGEKKINYKDSVQELLLKWALDYFKWHIPVLQVQFRTSTTYLTVQYSAGICQAGLAQNSHRRYFAQQSELSSHFKLLRDPCQC